MRVILYFYVHADIYIFFFSEHVANKLYMGSGVRDTYIYVYVHKYISLCSMFMFLNSICYTYMCFVNIVNDVLCTKVCGNFIIIK